MQYKGRRHTARNAGYHVLVFDVREDVELTIGRRHQRCNSATTNCAATAAAAAAAGGAGVFHARHGVECARCRLLEEFEPAEAGVMWCVWKLSASLCSVRRIN